MAYLRKSWKSVRADLSAADDSPPSAAGRPPTPIPPEAERRIVELREQGETLAAIADALGAEFGLRLAKSTLHAIWTRLEMGTPDGERITQLRKRFGLSRAFWRRYLAADRLREAQEAGRSSPSSAASPASDLAATPAASSGSSANS